MAGWLTEWLTLLSVTDQLTEWLMADWLTAWLTDWLRAYWVMRLLTRIQCDWLYCPRSNINVTVSTVGWLPNWLNNLWLVNCKTSKLYSPWTSKVVEWFIADWLTDKLTQLCEGWLTNWIVYGWLIAWLANSTVQDRPTNWMIYGWLIGWLADSTVQGLTNCPNGLWLVDWPSNWLYCPETDQLTEWFIVGWLTN